MWDESSPLEEKIFPIIGRTQCSSQGIENYAGLGISSLWISAGHSMFCDNPIHIKVDVFLSFPHLLLHFFLFLSLVFLGQQRCSKAAERDWTRVDRGRLRDKERNRISEQCQKWNRRVVRNNSRRNSPNIENRHVGICCKEYYCKQYQKKYSK